MSNKNSAFQSITNNPNSNNFRPNYEQLNNHAYTPQYQILKSFDSNTLNNMSNNSVNFSNNNLSDPIDFSNFVSHRDPSLNFGMQPLPIQNMTTYPNQLSNSLDLLAQTDQLTISNMNKRSQILDNKRIATNEIEEPYSQFQGISTPNIPYNEYTRPTGMFDNFSGEGRTDIIREYVCHINSIDRDVKRYPNPFNFLVQFAPTPENRDASISRTFSNIRYLKIETAVLPRKYYLTKKQITNNNLIVDLLNGPLPLDNQIINNDLVIIYAYDDNRNNKRIINYTEYDDDIKKSYECVLNNFTNQVNTYLYTYSDISLEDEKYTIIYLNDINDVSQFSTDQALSKAFNVFYPMAVFGYSLYVDSTYSDKIYKYSNLGNMNRMQINMTNSIGKELTTNINCQDINVPNINSTSCSCSTDPQTGDIIRDYKCICNYIRHPRFIKNQLDIMFKFGIIETDFDKRAFN